MTRPPLALLDPYLPEWMNEWQFLGLTTAQWVGLLALAVVALAAGLLLQAGVLWVSRALVRRTAGRWDDDFLSQFPGPLRWFLTLFLFAQLLHLLELNREADGYLRALLGCGLIVVLGWFVLRLVTFASRVAEAYFTRGLEGTPQARAVHTQVAVARVVLRFLVAVVVAALVLMQFEVARSLGVSLLASAGVAGAAIGFASQRTIATLFAGIQLALTKTAKIGDSVVVEGQFGTIEDITLTHVLVKTWDLRRLIVPVTTFTEKPFENWTAQSTDLLGTVFVYADYSVPLEEVREELRATLEGTKLWDGKVQQVVVTELQPGNVQLRVLVSAANGGQLWDLRCLVRERLLRWLQKRGRAYLPRQRVQAERGTNGHDGDGGLIVPTDGSQAQG